jgi:hypothetical protein
VGRIGCRRRRLFPAYLYLRLFSEYFLAPVDPIAVLYTGRFAVLSWEKTQLWRKCIVSVLVLIVVFQNIPLSAVKMYHRKNVIHAKVEIVRVVGEQYRVIAGHSLRLFFPFASPYVIMEFAAYLSYRGIPIVGADSADAGPGNVALVSPAVAKDGPCIWYQKILCRAFARPVSGDFVIVCRTTRHRARRLRLIGLAVKYSIISLAPRFRFGCSRRLAALLAVILK